MIGRFALVDHRRLGRQDRAAAGQHLDLALSAGAATAAGGRNEDAFFGQALHQLAADGNSKFALVVDDDLYTATRHEARACCEDDEHEHENDRRKQRHAEDDLGCDRGVQSWIPDRPMKPSDIRPVMMNVMPRPCSPSGTSL